MKRVTKQTKRRRCKACKGALPLRATGRALVYCCAACRQRDYRKRVGARPATPVLLLKDDLFAIKDREARKRAAIAVLEDFGYAVSLERTATRPRPSLGPRPNLQIVNPVGSKERSDLPDSGGSD
jgi:hypothetical protein